MLDAIEPPDSGTHPAHKIPAEIDFPLVFVSLPLIEQISELRSQSLNNLNGVRGLDSARHLIAQQHIYKDGPRFRASERETLRETT